MFNDLLEDIYATLKLSGSSQPFLTMAVPSSRVFGKKYHGQHQNAIGKAEKCLKKLGLVSATQASNRSNIIRKIIFLYRMYQKKIKPLALNDAK